MSTEPQAVGPLEERPGAGSDLNALLDQIEQEAAEEGPEGVLKLRALQAKYRFLSFLIEQRRARHLTQKELAERVGMAQAQLSKIERGRKSPTLDTYSRLLAALDAEVPLPHVTEVTVAAAKPSASSREAVGS